MVRLIAFCILAVSICLSSFADDKAKVANVQEFDFDLMISDNGVPAITQQFDLTNVNANSEVKCFVRITNRSDKPLTLRRVEVGCACTDAQVPQETLQPEGIVYSSFTFPALKVADRGGMSVVIHSEGVVSRVNVVFSGAVSNLAKFKDNVVSLDFNYEDFLDNKSGSLAEFMIPLVVSRDVSIEQLKFDYDPKLPIVKHSFEKLDGVPCLKVYVDPGEMDPDGREGIITLSNSTGPKVSVPCYIRQASRISVSPNALSFQQTRTAMAFLRIKSIDDRKTDAKAKADPKEVEVHDITDLSGRFKVASKRIGSGVYRLEVEPKAETKEVDTSKPIRLEITTSEGAFQKHIRISSW